MKAFTRHGVLGIQINTTVNSFGSSNAMTSALVGGSGSLALNGDSGGKKYLLRVFLVWGVQEVRK